MEICTPILFCATLICGLFSGSSKGSGPLPPLPNVNIKCINSINPMTDMTKIRNTLLKVRFASFFVEGMDLLSLERQIEIVLTYLLTVESFILDHANRPRQ